MERLLQIQDFRETKVYQKALEEGQQEGRKQGLEEIAGRLLAEKFPVALGGGVDRAAAGTDQPTQAKKRHR